MRCALYARVSTDDKDQDPSLQLEDLRHYVDAMGWTLYKEYIDYHSAYKKADTRPMFNTMLRDARLRHFDILLVYDLTRFSRDDPLRVHTVLNTLVNDYHIRFISLHDGIDSNNPAWTLIMSVLTWLSNNYSKQLGLKVKAGIRKRISKGEGWGRKKVLTKDQIEKARELKNQGLSYRKIGRKLNVSHVTVRNYILSCAA